jgi:tubulin delta
VWPFEAGDVSVQAFNAALTLTHVAAAADGVIILDNDGAHAVCQRALRIARPGFEDLNRFMARSLAALLLPSAVVRGGGDADVRAMALLAEPAQHLFSRPSLRLAAARVIPQMPLESRAYSTHTWEALSRLLCDMTAAAATCEVVLRRAVGCCARSGRRVRGGRHQRAAAKRQTLDRAGAARQRVCVG